MWLYTCLLWCDCDDSVIPNIFCLFNCYVRVWYVIITHLYGKKVFQKYDNKWMSNIFLKVCFTYWPSFLIILHMCMLFSKSKFGCASQDFLLCTFSCKQHSINIFITEESPIGQETLFFWYVEQPLWYQIDCCLQQLHFLGH